MGLFDRLLNIGAKDSGFSSKPAKPEKPAAKQGEQTFFLDPDTSSSMGNVEYMRRANKIRRTFPGNADNPGDKEMVQEVDSMSARLEKASSGLPVNAAPEASISLTGGVPKPVKKTFAARLTSAELGQRLKGAAVAVNTPGGSSAGRKPDAAGASQPQITQKPAKPGDIDPFKAMARDLNN